MLRIEKTFDATEALVSTCFAAYLFFALPLVGPAFWAMVDAGLASGVRWVGQLMLLALVLEVAGIFLLARTVPPAASPVGVLGAAPRFIVVFSRWLVGLMILILGLLGFGIDVRPDPSPIVVVVLLTLPALREVLVYRLLFRARVRRSDEGGGSPHRGYSIGDLPGKLLCLPARLVMLTLIEGGLFVDLATTVRQDIQAASTLGQVGMVMGFGLVIAVLYAILIFLPLRAVELVRMHRSRRTWAWVPAFFLEAVLIEVALLT